jgi:ribonuclease-3
MTVKKTSLKQLSYPKDNKLLEKALGYSFVNPLLLKQALTHRSYGVPNNEKFEFVGDSILNYVIARMLYEQFAELDEGDLSLLRAKLVNQLVLTEAAKGIQLGDYLWLGDGEIRNNGFDRSSILADALEALFAAICFDTNFIASEKIIRKLFDSRVSCVHLALQIKDAKTMLQETLQSFRLPLPKYTVTSQVFRANKQWFSVECEISQLLLCATGSGYSKRLAEQAAAEMVLVELKSNAICK